MRRFAALTWIFVATTLASAQIPTAGNIFFGYSYSGGDVFYPGGGASHTGFNGWDGSLEGKFLPWIGIVADVSGHYGSASRAIPLPVCPPSCSFVASANARRYAALFGPRVSISVGKFTPFAHALVGAAHVSDSGGGLSNSDTSLATAIGGGLDYKLIKGIAWRLQGDELHTRFFGSAQDHFRFSTGIVLRF